MNTSDETVSRPASRERSISEADLNQIRESLRDLRFGSINVVVQDGVIVQIDRTEKRRLRRGNGSS